MIKTELEILLERAKTELELLNLSEHAFGKAFLDLLKESHLLTKGDPALTRMFLNMPTRVYNGFPLSPITKEEFEKDNEGTYRCSRYEPAFLGGNDNKYYDSHAIGFVNPKQPYCITYGKNENVNSTMEITQFPYYPQFKIVEL